MPRQKGPTLKPKPGDLGWVAGLLEGEGSFHTARTNSRLDGRRYAYPRIACHMVDADIIDRLQTVTGMGSVNERQPRGLSKKVSYNWQVQKNRDAVSLMNKLLPLMGKRRQDQIRTALIDFEVQKGWVR